jgi:hypothetical protein
MPEFVPIPPINRNAVIGFISALVAIVAICAIILPVPFAALICYPPGILLAVTSIVFGIKSQRELLIDGKSGRPFAVIAVWVGGLALLSYVCMLTAGAILLPHVTEYISQYIN